MRESKRKPARWSWRQPPCTTAALALTDALAMAVLDARGFGPDDFARSHPGGALGRRLLTYVRDIMRTGDAVPQVGLDATVSEALLEITSKRMGMTAVVSANAHVEGIFYSMAICGACWPGSGDFRTLRLCDVMSKKPRTIGADHLAVAAVELMERHKIGQILVTDDDGALIGALNTYDLLEATVI